MTMKNATKIEKELICRFKIDMKNLTRVLESLKNVCFNWLLVTKVHKLELQKYRGVFHDTEELYKF